MQTKKELLDTLPNDVFGDILDQIDFSYLDNFIKLLISGYITKHGEIIVKREIDEDSQSDTSNFLTHVIEVGSLKILLENNLLNLETKRLELAILSVALGIDISMATVLKSKNVYDLDSKVYYSFDALERILPRIDSHVVNAKDDNAYIKNLVNDYLLFKI
jgi:hypothetical protein